MDEDNNNFRSILDVSLARTFAFIAGACGIIGLFVSGHLFELMNTDAVLDVSRIALAAYLFYASFISRDRETIDVALLVFGIAYLGIGTIGLFDRTLGGLLPSGLTEFDLIFHLAAGALATYVGARYLSSNRAVYRTNR